MPRVAWSSRLRRRGLRIAIVGGNMLLVVLPPALPDARTAHAAPAQPRARASEALFQQGLALWRAKEWGPARDLFLASHQADPTVSALMMASECEEHLGRFATALRHATAGAELAAREGHPKLASVRARADRLRDRAAKLVVLLPDTPKGLRLFLDDTLQVETGERIALPVDPGTHTLRVVAPKHRPWSTTVQSPEKGREVAIRVPPRAVESGRLHLRTSQPRVGLRIRIDGIDQGESPLARALVLPLGSHALIASAEGYIPHTETITIPHDEAEVTVTIPPLVPTQRRERSSPVHTYASLGLVGVGALSIGAGAYFGLRAKSGRDEASCRENVCPTESASVLYNESRAFAQAATWFFVVGGAALAGGIVYFALSRGSATTLGVGLGSVSLSSSF